MDREFDTRARGCLARALKPSLLPASAQDADDSSSANKGMRMGGELTTNTGSETSQLRFQRFLSLGSFAALKAILDKIAPDAEALWEAARTAASYEELLVRLGYKLLLVRQIHVQDAYSRLGPAGGIKAVLPYHDVATYSSFPTLINFDCTLTNTAKGAAFFNELFTELKRQLKVQP